MTVEELCLRLTTLNNTGYGQYKITVYEGDADDFLVVGKIEVHEEIDNNQVRLHSQYAVDGDMC